MRSRLFRIPVSAFPARLLCLLPASLLFQAATAATLIVPDDYTTIQAAINAAGGGDTVLVEPGTYAENISLRSNIDVRGREAARTFIDAGNLLPAVTITNAQNILFANFTIIDSTIGIDIINSTGITIASNIFDSLSQVGVRVDALANVELINNNFWRNQTAIQRFTVLTEITNNIFARNLNTITSGIANPVNNNVNVSYSCFYLNLDLVVGGVDTALGTQFQIGDPLFVDTAAGDFHLEQSSPCIDTGTGTDIIDDTIADIGAYGGQEADAFPFPVAKPVASDVSAGSPKVFNIKLDWKANLSYLVTNTGNPGSYRVWYRLNAAGPPYDGTDAGGGTLPSPVDPGDVTSYTLADLQPSVATPPTPSLVSALPANRSVELTWTAATGATGYRIGYGIASITENTVDVGNVTRFSVTGLSNDMTYLFVVSAMAKPVYHLAVTVVDNTQDQNQSDYSPDTSIAIGPASVSGVSNTLMAMPEAVVPVPNLSDDHCFIASAAFAGKWATEVSILRDFRDRFLLGNAPGRRFVTWYYRNGPAAARFINAHPALKPMVRAGLAPLVVLALFLLAANGGVILLIAALAILLLGLVTRRRGRGASRSDPAVTS